MSELNEPLVSVYITNYNYGKFLQEAIESVLAQTFKYFELIIIDDGSTDNSREIISRYDGIENVFSLFQENRGLIRSSNVALNLARGKYIMRLDADDYITSQALEIMISELSRHPEAVLVFPDYYLIDETGELMGEFKRHNFEKDVKLRDQPAHGACSMIRKDVLKSIGGYDPAFSMQDGYDLWLSIENLYPIRNINLPLFYYRQHDASLSKDESKLLETRSKIKEKHVIKRGLKALTVLAIIPVRGESTDPRSRPFKKLGKKCLIDWTIEVALASQLVKDVIVTSPENKVLDYTKRKYPGIILVERDRNFASINSGIEDTVFESLNFYSRDHQLPDAVMLLYIESPFRSSMYIDKAIHTLQLYDVDNVDGVRPDNDMFYVHKGNGLEPWHGMEPWSKSKTLRLERQELYRRTGGIHLILTNTLFEKKNILGGKIGHIILDQSASFSIRSELDWDIAEIIASKEIIMQEDDKVTTTHV
jgi:glycosyltransferase involved in cell wall biosynthesis